MKAGDTGCSCGRLTEGSSAVYVVEVRLRPAGGTHEMSSAIFEGTISDLVMLA